MSCYGALRMTIVTPLTFSSLTSTFTVEPFPFSPAVKTSVESRGGGASGAGIGVNR